MWKPEPRTVALAVAKSVASSVAGWFALIAAFELAYLADAYGTHWRRERKRRRERED